MDEFVQLDAVAQAELVKKGDITPMELVDAALARIDAINPALNAVVTSMAEEARAAAAANKVDGALAGVPFLLKDLGAMFAGVRLTSGCKVLQEFVPPIDSTIVARYKQAGLITLGKTNTPEFGILPTTEPELFGPCRNPWHPEYMVGGSSGGAAAAVAAGLVPVAHGSDGGGSIRIPASCCGVFGFKPTRARTPRGPLYGDVMSGIAIAHCISRSVRDSAAVLDATAGPEPGDPYWAPPQTRPYLEEVGTPPGKLRIAFSTQALSAAFIHPDCVAAVEETAALCADLGHELVEAAPPIDGERFAQAFSVVWAAGCAWSVKGVARLLEREPSPEMFEPVTWGLYEMGERQSSADYLLAIQTLQQISRQAAYFFQAFDVWLTPTVAEPPLPLGEFDPKPGNPMNGFERALKFVPFTPIANVTGQPAMSVPLVWNEMGLPVGSQFVGRFGDEATLFRLAAQLEEAHPWANRWPPVSAGRRQ